MPLNYVEFDSTPQTLAYDLMQAVLGSTDWSRVGAASTIVATTANASVGASSVSVSSGHSIVVGQTIRIGPEGGSTTEYKNVTAVAATSVTFSGQTLVYAQPSGTVVGTASMILKSTTTRGADLIFDLVDGQVELSNLNLAVWRAHDGTVGAVSGGTDRTSRWLYWRGSASGALWNMPLHCIVSAGKDHVFISVEGPRANEPAATSSVVGSLRNYFFMDDVVPYHANDLVPVCFAGGMMADTATVSPANNSHQGHFSRNFADTSSWSAAKTLTLDFPSTASTETVQVMRQTSADGKYYFSPYVAFGDESGIRGRLANFFHVGFTYSDTPEIATAPIGQKVQFDGRWFKLTAVSKSDGSIATWGQFGSAGNSGAPNFFRSPIVAIPTTAP